MRRTYAFVVQLPLFLLLIGILWLHSKLVGEPGLID